MYSQIKVALTLESLPVLTIRAPTRTADLKTTVPARLLQKVSSLISNVVFTDFLFRNSSALCSIHNLTSHQTHRLKNEVNIDSSSRIILRIVDQAMAWRINLSNV